MHIDSFLPLWDKHLLNDDSCPFCQRILNGQYTMFTRTAVAFEPLNPVTRGHLLLVPSVHITSRDSSSLGLTDVASLIRRLTETSVGDAKPDFNLIVNAGPNASQTIDHFHMHYIPRVADDRLVLPWTDQKKYELDIEGNFVCRWCDHYIVYNDAQNFWVHTDGKFMCKIDDKARSATPRMVVRPDEHRRYDQHYLACRNCDEPIMTFGNPINGIRWRHAKPYPTYGCVNPEPYPKGM